MNENINEFGGLLEKLWRGASISATVSNNVRDLGAIADTHDDERMKLLGTKLAEGLGDGYMNEIYVVAQLSAIIRDMGDKLLTDRKVVGLQISEDTNIVGYGNELRERILEAAQNILDNRKPDELDEWTSKQAQRLRNLILE